MKRLLLFTLIMFACSNIYAQLDIKLPVNKLVTKRPEVGLEVGYDKFSIELVNGIIFQKWGEATIIDADGTETEIGIKRFGYNGGLRANYYFKPDDSLDGWFVSPIVRYCSQKIQFEDPVKNKRVGAAVTFGRKGQITDDFGYSFEAGYGYWFVNSYKNSAGKSTPVFQEIPFFSSLAEKLDKMIIPFTATVYYRIGN